MGDNLQLNIVGVEGKRTPIVIDKTRTLRELYDEVKKKCGLSLADGDDIRLVYAGNELENSENQKIKNLEIPSNAQIYMVVRVRGGRKD